MGPEGNRGRPRGTRRFQSQTQFRSPALAATADPHRGAAMGKKQKRERTMLSLKSKLIAGAGLVTVFGVLLPVTAFAQEPAAGAVEEVIVTGSRIRSGFQTPTP